MLEINKESVLNGTLHKRLFLGYESMKTNGLTQESADAYRNLYENESLSDILSESELIFKEPINGLKFYESIMTESKVPLHRYPEELKKICEFVEDNKAYMSDEQKALYESTIDEMKSYMETRKNEITLSLSPCEESVKEMICEMCDDLYKNPSEECDSVTRFFESAPLTQKILYGYYILPNYNSNQLSHILHMEMAMTEAVEENISDYSATATANVVSSYINEDTAVKEDVRHQVNVGLKLLMSESASEDYRRVLNEIFTERVVDYDPGFRTPENAIMRMFDDDLYSEAMSDIYLQQKVVNNAKAKTILEAVLDLVYAENLYAESDSEKLQCNIAKNVIGNDDITIKEAMDYLTEKVNYMDEIIQIGISGENFIQESGDDSFFEFTRRGEATPVIRNNTGNLRENPDRTRDTQKKNENDYDDFEDDDDVTPRKVIKTNKNRMHQSDAELTTREPKNKPELQKQSLTRKIQNKAMDLDVKMQKNASIVQQGATNLKNAAKAVLRLPDNIKRGFERQCDEWNRMEENKRKEKILEPGYRNEIFKALKTAIVYGAIWQYKKYMVIVAFICKHTILSPFFKADANRTKRLRNELTAELETEIAVTEEKINDASANGDQKQKYELIRIKKKLEAEKVRVSTNSKFI